jgi:hypothetical protein
MASWDDWPEVGLTGARFGGGRPPEEGRPATGSRRAGARVLSEPSRAGGSDVASDTMEPGEMVPVVPVVPAGAGEWPGEPAEEVPGAAPPVVDPDAQAGPVVGLTGARFGGSARRRGGWEPWPEEAPAAALGAAGSRAAGPDDAGPDRAAPDGAGAETAGAGAETAGAGAEIAGADPAGPDGARDAAAHDVPAEPARALGLAPLGFFDTAIPDPVSSSFVRPYVLTRGRTRSAFELAIETLVSAVPRETGEPGPHQDIVDLCREPRSVAEIAALRGVPLGVAKVLLGDLAQSGAVAVHRTVDASGPDVALMERVLSGLRRL